MSGSNIARTQNFESALAEKLGNKEYLYRDNLFEEWNDSWIPQWGALRKTIQDKDI